jgi:hypothetical protein
MGRASKGVRTKATPPAARPPRETGAGLENCGEVKNGDFRKPGFSKHLRKPAELKIKRKHRQFEYEAR